MTDFRPILRRFCVALVFIASACTTATSITGINGPIPPSALTTRQSAFLDTLERRTFNWFWERTDPNNGLTPDRWPTKSFSSIAAVGFALTAYPVGVERGYVPRADAAQRTLNTLRFLYNAPQGPQATNVTGYKGFFYHFLDMQTGYRFEQVELSTIDTSLLLHGRGRNRECDPGVRRLDLSPHRLGVGGAQPARRQHGLAPGERLHQFRLEGV